MKKLMIHHHYILVVICIFVSMHATAQLTTIPTADKQATLNILVEYPEHGAKGKKKPVVVLAGGVFTDRDGITDLGEVASEKNTSFLFKQLSQQLLSMGFIVIRYDQRGINGNIFTCEKGVKLSFETYIKKCVDSKVRSTVTLQNTRADYESVFNFASRLKTIDAKKIYVLGHSEASLHIATLIGEKRISPIGTIFIAGLVESPSKHAEWQAIGRFVEALPLLDEDKDGVVTNAEIQKAFRERKSALSQQTQNGEQLFLSPTGSWKLNDLKSFQDRIDQLLYKPLLASMNVPNPSNSAFTSTISSVEVTFASREWMLGRMSDNQRVIDRLDSFSGKGLFIFFSLDSQISVARQIAAIEKSKFSLAHKAKVITINGFGHVFGKLPGVGPVEPQAMNEVSAAIRAWLPASIQSG
jgi:hypothetical protein